MLSHEGYEFQTEVVKNDYDPQFNPKTSTFKFNIQDASDPGHIDIRVRYLPIKEDRGGGGEKEV